MCELCKGLGICTFDVEMPLEHDFHLVVRIRVVERRAFFQPVEAAGDGGGGGCGLALGVGLARAHGTDM